MLDVNYRLRYNEYYGLQGTFDKLYEDSKKNKKFNKLYDLIISDNNIKLAYRTIKSNTGSKTRGTDGRIIEDYKNISEDEIIRLIRSKLSNYRPGLVRRVHIPKSNGKTRPLGIPTMIDRLIQQCFKQVLEPIVEAKFYDHSYGFRPNRGVEHAIFRAQSFINKAKLHYCIDVDIKSFFDEINHGKLIKQLWHLGIQDKKVISIISKMLKAEIQGEGKPTKGTPQGGILSPLLANVVLNELDWWVASQWEQFKPLKDDRNKHRVLKRTNLKEVYIVRYADDFKIFCRDYKVAKKMFQATKDWIEERLKLEVSEEKSKITNLRDNYSEFLGFKMKAVKKYREVTKPKHLMEGRRKMPDEEVVEVTYTETYYAVKSHMSDKAIINAKNKLLEKIKTLQSDLSHGGIGDLNSMILGMHNYYRIATHVSIDFYKIDYLIRIILHNRLKNHIKYKPIEATGRLYKEKYGSYKGKIPFLNGIAIFPICCVRNKYPLAFKRTICDYTVKGRKEIYKKLDSDIAGKLSYLIKFPLRSESIELNDNRLSKFSAQKGKCGVSGKELILNEFETHHKNPRRLGGDDSYNNLILVTKEIHKLIHVVEKDVIDNLIKIVKLNSKQLEKLNDLRLKVGNQVITI